MNVRRLFLLALSSALLLATPLSRAAEEPVQPLRPVPDFTEPETWFRQGLEFNRAGRYGEAAEAFRRVIAIQPGNADARFNLGTAYSLLGRYQEAVEELREAVRINPDFAQAYNNLGVLYDNLGRYPEAVEAYQQVVRIRPDDAAAHYNLGLAYLSAGDLTGARKQGEILLKLDRGLADRLMKAIQPEGELSR